MYIYICIVYILVESCWHLCLVIFPGNTKKRPGSRSCRDVSVLLVGPGKSRHENHMEPILVTDMIITSVVTDMSIYIYVYIYIIYYIYICICNWLLIFGDFTVIGDLQWLPSNDSYKKQWWFIDDVWELNHFDPYPHSAHLKMAYPSETKKQT